MRHRYGVSLSFGWPHRIRLLPQFFGVPEGWGFRIFWLDFQVVLHVARERLEEEKCTS